METSKTYQIILSDGSEITNLELNGNNFISEDRLTENTFTGKLNPVIIRDSNGGEETIENGELIALREYEEKIWFVIREIPANILKERKTQADIQYIAMMTDIELEV